MDGELVTDAESIGDVESVAENVCERETRVNFDGVFPVNFMTVLLEIVRVTVGASLAVNVNAAEEDSRSVAVAERDLEGRSVPVGE